MCYCARHVCPPRLNAVQLHIQEFPPLIECLWVKLFPMMRHSFAAVYSMEAAFTAHVRIHWPRMTRLKRLLRAPPRLRCARACDVCLWSIFRFCASAPRARTCCTRIFTIFHCTTRTLTIIHISPVRATLCVLTERL